MESSLPKLEQEYFAALAEYVGDIRDEAERGGDPDVAGALAWALAGALGVPELARADGRAAAWSRDVSAALDAMRKHEDVLLARRWMQQLATRMSGSFIDQLRARRRLVRAAAAEIRATVSGVLSEAAAAVRERLGELDADAAALAAEEALSDAAPAFQTALMARLGGLELGAARMSRLVARVRDAIMEVGAAQAPAPNAHPLVRMGLTFGADVGAPVGADDVPDGAPVFDAGTGGRPVVYDLRALTAPARGDTTTTLYGLNFRVVDRLNTVRWGEANAREKASDVRNVRENPGHVDAWRRDGEGVARPVRFARADGLAAALRGPPAALEAYNALAAPCVDLIPDAAELVRRFELREPDAEPEEVPDEAALAKFASRRQRAFDRRLDFALMRRGVPGARAAQDYELALTMALQVRALRNVANRQNKSGGVGLYSVIRDAPMESLKMAALGA